MFSVVHVCFVCCNACLCVQTTAAIANKVQSVLNQRDGFSMFTQLARLPCGTQRVTYTQSGGVTLNLETNPFSRDVLKQSSYGFCSASLPPVHQKRMQ